MDKEIAGTREKAKLSSHAHNFPIVGIGASAGGLDAFKKLLEPIPLYSEMAYVVVQHLNPNYESNLTEILSRITKIPIEEVADEVKILPNHIYVMPEGKILTSVDGVLKLTPRENVKTNLVIDIFFTSIAVVWESMAVGVVLSGTGSDGTVGLKMIKEHGGITIAQDESAAYGDMPQSAVNAQVVDFVLPAEKIADQLSKINNTYTAAHAIGEEEALPKNDGLVFEQMLQVLYQFSGVDFIHYKQSTVRRRIGRRMALHKRGDLTDYLKFLRSDKAEQEQLYHDMLISVTSFFRDPKIFETLCEKILPRLLKSKPEGEAIRFWIAGCASGEETYSIAICLYEFLDKKLLNNKVQLFASDLSETAINKARAGIYSKEEVQTLSPERLHKYFTKSEGSYRINKEIRDLCVFAIHNFLKNPPFAKMDFISCRNVLIYMDSFLQKKALTTFHYALRENGILLLGKSESVSAASELFITSDKQHKIYSRKTGAGHFMRVATERREQTLTTQNSAAKRKSLQTDFRSSANAILISKSPAAVIINDEMDIVHIHENIEPFLKHAPGKPSLNLLKMASGSLAFELRNAIHKAKTSQDSVIKEEISDASKAELGVAKVLISIEVIPLIDIVEPHYLIVFTKTPLTAKEESLNNATGDRKEALKRIEQLEKELIHAREDMHSITEEMETANEELQSSNEELLSSNEEMQSLNEELVTSKEEVQSSNEELISLNQELNDNQENLNAARDYSEAIVSTIKEPLLVLDKNLRIKSANDSFYKKFKLTEQETEGRFFHEIQNNQWDNLELRSQLAKILPQISRMEDFEMILDERIMLLNAREILSEKNAEQLILLAIEDVTDSRMAKRLKVSENAHAKIAAYLKLATDSANIGTWSLDVQTQVLKWNNLHKRMWGYDEHRTDLTYEDWHKLILPEDKEKAFIEIEDAKVNHTFYEVEYRIGGTDDEYVRCIRSVGKYYYNDKGEAETLTGISMDITEQRDIEQKLKESGERFRNLADQSPMWVWMADENVYVTYANKEILDFVGLSHYSQLTAHAWEAFVHPDDIQVVYNAIGVAQSEATSFEFRVKNAATGKYEWFLIKAVPHILDNIPVGFIGTGININANKIAMQELSNSEERFRSLAETLPQLVWMTNENGEYEYASQQWMDYSGLDPLKAETWAQLVHEDDINAISKAWKNSLETGQTYLVETRLKSKEHEYRWHLVQGQPVRNNEGEIIKWIGAFSDIHEQKLNEQKKDEFISIASHEMKTPLTTAKGYIELLLLSLSEEDQTAIYATKANHAVERLHELVTELLDASKIQNGQLNYTITTFDFDSLIDEILETFQHTTTSHSIEKIGSFSKQLTGDNNRLQQVVINLLSNAIKYSPKADKVIVKIEEQENKVQVSVQDFGVGMSEKHLDKIFDRYYRVEEHAIKFQGLGMGLYISSNIIARHNGTMWVESELGKGSTFYFTLPI